MVRRGPFFIFSFIMFSFATRELFSLPTAESLLRNSANSELSKAWVKVSFTLKKGTQATACEWIFLKKGPQIPWGLLQKCDGKTLYIPGLLNKINDSIDQPKKSYFYAVNFWNFLNVPYVMISLLKKNDSSFVLNHDLVNHERVALYKKFQEYLGKTKNNPKLRDQLHSPLKAYGDTQARPNELLKSPFYKEQENVKYEVIAEKPYLLMQLQTFKMRFDILEHRMRFFELLKGSEELLLEEVDYHAIEADYQVPQRYLVKSRGDVWSFQLDSFKSGASIPSEFTRMIQDARELGDGGGINGDIPFLWQ